MKIPLLKGLLLAGAFLCISLAKAQTVSGTVYDENNQPLPGASVVVKGTTNGAQTDFDGNYTLDNVGSDATLLFSYIGYKTQEIAVNGQSTINATMQEDTQALDEVVVIGYGQTTVKDATGAVAVVTSDEFNQGVIASPEQLIQGKTAGVQITQSSGEPGAGINIRIRGTASVRSNNNPLFVVDGVPLAGDDTSAGGGDVGAGTSSARNPLNFLNPNDIESISILKDASATAIYGSRGANGVVIITTKSGKSGQGGTFEFNSSLSYATAANKFDLLNRDQYLKAVSDFGGDAASLDFGSNTDWQRYIFRSTASQNQNLAYSNNYGSGYVRASFGYGKQFGIVENSSQEKITARINASQRFFKDKLKLDVNATISRVNDEAPFITNTAGSTGDLIGATYFANPTWPTSTGFSTGSDLIPSQLLAFYQDLTNTNRELLNGSAEYAILDNLKAKVSLGFDQSHSDKNQSLSSQATGFTNGIQGNGRGAYNIVDTKNRLLDFTLNYNKDFDNAKLEVLVGYSFQDFKRSGKVINGFGFSTTDLNQMASDLERASSVIENSITGRYQQYGYDADGLFINRLFPNPTTDMITPPTVSGVAAVSGDTFNFTDELQSFFGRVNYTIAGKYLLTATLRVDGSSRFGPDNQYGYFPSGAFAWKLNEEDFVGDAFSTLKLRLGYGITGNQDGLGYGNFTFRQRYTGQPNQVPGVSIDNGGNINPSGLEVVAFPQPALKWEQTSQANIGVDFGFMNDRLNGSIDVYHKNTTDLLLKKEVAQPSPQPFSFENLDANVINKGIEFSLNYDIIQLEDVTWNAGFNISYNDNLVKNFDGLIQTGAINGNGLTGAFAQLLANNRPLFSYYLRKFGGFDNDGLTIYPDGDVQEFVGKSALPKYNGGFSTSLTYKNWSANVFFAGQFGQYIYNNTQNAFFTAGIIAVGKNVTQDVVTSGENGANAADVSTRFLEKGDFVRLQNASIAYKVPMSGKGLFKTIQLSLTGQNLLLITGYSGLDPEVNVPKPLNDIPSLGIDYTTFPRPTTVTLGINATF